MPSQGHGARKKFWPLCVSRHLNIGRVTKKSLTETVVLTRLPNLGNQTPCFCRRNHGLDCLSSWGPHITHKTDKQHERIFHMVVEFKDIQ